MVSSVRSKPMIRSRFERSAFRAHPALRNRHAQTIVAPFLPRGANLVYKTSEASLFQMNDSAQLLAQCSLLEPAPRRVLVLVHGLEGSSESAYILGTAERALTGGISAVRVNLRGCGNTEHLSRTPYHAGLTQDLRALITELVSRARVDEVYVAGFSLGGNMVLKLAAEYGSRAPSQLRGVIAVCPSVDLVACSRHMELPENRLYTRIFLSYLKTSLRRRARLYPDLYDVGHLNRTTTLRDFDDRYIAPMAGFRDAMDYYRGSSSLSQIPEIAVPTLIIHSDDDPIIPAELLLRPEIADNPAVTLLITEGGGHLGFVSADRSPGERFWYENTILEFIRSVSEAGE